MTPLLYLSCAVAILLQTAWAYKVEDDSRMKLDPKPFEWGVASGDPTMSSVILWTRIEQTEKPVSVSISTEESMVSMSTKTHKTLHPPSKDNDFTVHMKITDLQPDTVYYYRFEVDGHFSRTGRTKTAPSTEDRAVRIGVVSCSSHWDGWYNAYRSLLSKKLDFVIHMGDVVYNSLPPMEWERRRVPSSVPSFVDPHNLTNWRQLHAFLRMDADFRNLLAHLPWVVQWDNHDVVHEGGKQAFMEWFPLQLGDEAHIDRQLSYGPLLDVFVIDTHLGHEDGGGELVGARQMQTLIAEIPKSKARYRLLSSTKTLSPWKVFRLPLKLFHENAELKHLSKGALHPRNWIRFKKPTKSQDEGHFHLWKSHDIYFDLGLWDGSPDERRQLLKVLKAKGNNIVVSGDTHTALAADVINADEVHDYVACDQHAAAVEFAPPSITRGNWDEGLKKQFKEGEHGDVSWKIKYLRAVMGSANPHHAFVELTQHGYGILEISKEEVKADYFFLDFHTPLDDPVAHEHNIATLVMKHDTACWNRTLSRIPKYPKSVTKVLGSHIKHGFKKIGKKISSWFSAADMGYSDYYDDGYYEQSLRDFGQFDDDEYEDVYAGDIDEDDYYDSWYYNYYDALYEELLDALNAYESWYYYVPQVAE